MNSVRRAAREIALLVLFWADLQEGDDAQVVRRASRQYARRRRSVTRDLSLPDAGGAKKQLHRLAPSSQHWEFVERLVVGVASHLNSIDDMIGRFSNNWKVARMARVDGTYYGLQRTN